MTKPITIIQLSLCRTQLDAWQESLHSANWTALKLIFVCRWQTNGQWKCLHSILLAELLPTKNLHRVSADLCLLFQVSRVSAWTQSLKLTNVLNSWMTLESQPIMLQTSPGTFGQSSSSLANQDWKVPFRSQTIWIPRKNNFTRRNLNTSAENLYFLTNLYYFNPKKAYSDTWGSWTNKEVIFTRWLKNLIHSTNCSNWSANEQDFRIEGNIWFSQ